MNNKIIINRKRNAGFLRADFLNFLFIAILVAGVGYYFRTNLGGYLQRLANQVQPCARPITYSVVSVDPRFGITQEQLLSDIDKAGNIWDSSAGKKLFEYSPTGGLKISLVYDYRQQVTDALKKLGIVVTNDRNSYDTLKARYDALSAQYDQKKAYLDSLVAKYETEKGAYERDVQSSNARGGASKQEYTSLEQRRTDLNNQAALINQAQNSLNVLVDPINAMVVTLNKLVAELNLQVNQYNAIGSSTGKEFDEGVYISGPSGISITIYQFNDEAQLVRVLAHEMGHALGVDHLDNPKAIMYRLNEGSNAQLTADDITALKNRCGIK